MPDFARDPKMFGEIYTREMDSDLLSSGSKWSDYERDLGTHK